MTPGALHVGLPPGLDAELVADRCWLLGATAVGEVDGGLDVGFATGDEAAAAAASLADRWPGLDVEVLDPGPALQAALEAWRPHARPLRVGPLHVRPAWLRADDDPPAAGERMVVVDPTHAFGYDHPSTVACLEAMVAHVGPGTSVLDVGCGSGVLALAAAVLGAAPVVAVDVDPVAVAATAAAARAGGLDVAASSTPVGEVAGRFDLVVANIGAATIAALAPSLAARLDDHGHLVVAGILADQVGAVADALAAAGLELASAGEGAAWPAPVFLWKSTFSG